MTLVEAYERLQWGAPLSFKRTTLGKGIVPPFPRRIGTSAHMLVELYLDMCRSQGSLTGRSQFLVQCLSREQGRLLRTLLLKIHHVLNLDVGLEHVRFVLHDGDPTRLRGETWYSWAIFCDHSVKERDVFEAGRNVGPYGLIRRLEPDDSHNCPFWTAYDRDDQFIGALTENGKRELMDAATFPITLGGARPTTYPAVTLGPDVRIRLRKAFKQ